MCGPFNEMILDLALEKELELAGKGIEISFWAVGERIRSGLEDRGGKEQEYFALPGNIMGINGQVQLVVRTFGAWQRQKGVETLYTLFNQLGKGSSYHPVHSRLLPLDHTWLEQYMGQRWPGTCLPLLGLHWEKLFRHLFRQYLFVSLYRVFAQSMASENAARLNSMQAAEKNILEMEEDLQGKFRETRQTMITEELLDIISGFEAISGA
jgi:F-type H+-transporting ATPase subunit gamma